MGNVESRFQAEVIKDLRKMFKDSVILKNDAGYLQGVPDVLILFKNMWAALEVKANPKAPHQPNQDYYVEKLNKMSFASFVDPENKDEILHGLQLAFRTKRDARVPQCEQLSLD